MIRMSDWLKAMEQEFCREIFTIAVTCLQWGDSGKGKVVDLLALWADLIVRCMGGANAGHSVWVNGKVYVMHLIPSGILHDNHGKKNIIGSGTAIDPRILCEELALLESQKLPYNNLMLALNAKLTLPSQIACERVAESEAGSGKIGTTGRGISWTYASHLLRVDAKVNDLLNTDIFVANLRRNLEFSRRFLSSFDPDAVKAVMHHEHLGSGIYYSPVKIFDEDAIVEQYLRYGETLEPIIRDTDAFVRSVVGKKRVLLEGAQGSLLDVDHGTRPFVTGSNCTPGGMSRGAGLDRSDIDLELGIFKGFYETRVGEGPMPTEYGGIRSADWCRIATKQQEAERFGEVSVNDPNEFFQGIAIRREGDEYGATTKRPRRTGWLDLPLLRQALLWSGPNVVLTKLDVLNNCERIKVCYKYRYDGPAYHYGNKVLNRGDLLDEAIPSAEVLRHCVPLYESFPGWKKNLRGITTYSGLPSELRFILEQVVKTTKITPRIISIGPDREETIFV